MAFLCLMKKKSISVHEGIGNQPSLDTVDRQDLFDEIKLLKKNLTIVLYR